LNKNERLFEILLQEIDVGFVSHIYAMRLTHTGEDGFMLYIPSEVKKNFVRGDDRGFFVVVVCFMCV
jgi:glycine cleavage system aminomethyltransferase T